MQFPNCLLLLLIILLILLIIILNLAYVRGRRDVVGEAANIYIYIYIYILCVYYYYYMCLLLLMCSLSGGCPRAERCSRRGRRQVPTPRHLDPAVEAGTVCMYVCVYITRTYMIMFIMIVSSITNICLLLLLIWLLLLLLFIYVSLPGAHDAE